MPSLRPFLFCFVAAVLAVGVAPARAGMNFGPLWTTAAPPPVQPDKHKGLSKLKHVIFIIQENRSFDHYFGTYPGADGFPSPLPCLPSMWHPSQCETPYPNHNAVNDGGPYESMYQESDIDGGKMDGFVIQREKQLAKGGCTSENPRQIANIKDEEGFPSLAKCTVDVMGYHDGTDLPNYWAYAKDYVLSDHFFESVHSWSEPNHLEIFSGWSAVCKSLNPPDVNSCASSTGTNPWNSTTPVPYLWTDITYLLFQNNVTWGVYLDGGLGQPFGHNGVQHIQDVLPGFETVNDDGQLANSEINLSQFYTDAANGTLPQVSWILPQYKESEHPTASIAFGQTYVTGLINAIMSGPDWKTSAIFVEWDDPAGFYDHEPPAFNFDALGLGIRVPSILISPYARKNFIDHQVCSTDCYLKFIEDVFLGSERMDASGRPDPRPTPYRDQETQYGDLANDFNFSQKPRDPLILSMHPMTLLRDGDADADGPTVRSLPRRGVR